MIATKEESSKLIKHFRTPSAVQTMPAFNPDLPGGAGSISM